jgi:hypothetical protein
VTILSKPSRRLWPYLAVPALIVLVAGTILAGDFTADDGGSGGGSESATGLPGSWLERDELEDSELRPDPEQQRAAAETGLQMLLSERIDAYLVEQGLEELTVSVAVGNGTYEIAYNDEIQHDSASIVKVEILTMLLMHYGSVDAMPGWVVATAKKMIHESDNKATSEILFGLLDGHAAMREAHETFGLENTNPNETEQWGFTQTTAPDQLVMLRAALYEGFLDEDQAAFVRELMEELDDEQQWGLLAAVEDGETLWMKNGWDTRSRYGGNWQVNSIGIVNGDSDTAIELAVLTGGSASFEDGIGLVEDLAVIARDVIETDPFA